MDERGASDAALILDDNHTHFCLPRAVGVVQATSLERDLSRGRIGRVS